MTRRLSILWVCVWVVATVAWLAYAMAEWAAVISND